MKRLPAYALIACFAAMQLISLLHMAEHGFQEHRHHGQLCDIAFFSDQTKDADIPACVAAVAPAPADISLLGLSGGIVVTAVVTDAAPRAPPAFSIG